LWSSSCLAGTARYQKVGRNEQELISDRLKGDSSRRGDVVRVIKIKGTVVLEFPDGTRIRIDPAKAAKLTKPAGRPGRPLSPATLKVRAAMQKDHGAGTMQDREHYLGVLRKAGHQGGEASAYVILNREAKQAFGRTLGRAKRLKRKPRGGKRGRAPAPETVLLREKLQADKAAGKLRDAKHYLGWLMDQPGVKMGLKPAKPIVYRELRAVR
jgi:hypothetical protein